MARYKATHDDYTAESPREQMNYRAAPPVHRQYEDYDTPRPRPEPRRAWESDDDTYEPLPEDINPIREFQRPPRKGTGCLRAVWLMVTLPLRVVFWALRHLPKIVLIPTKIILSLAFVGLIFGCILAVIFGVKAGRYDLSQVTRMPERTIVLDRKGNEIGTLHGENRRSITNIHEEVPRYMIDALVMQEDRSFWTHGGVDPRGLLRAVAQVFKHHRTTQGASTLTMQLAKNTYNHSERTFTAKFTEMALARRIESTYDKTTILTCYEPGLLGTHFPGAQAGSLWVFR